VRHFSLLSGPLHTSWALLSFLFVNQSLTPFLSSLFLLRRDTVNVCVGAYRDENGEPWVLPSVRKAERILLEQDDNKEYLPIHGDQDFIEAAMKFAYGPDMPMDHLAAVQTVSVAKTLFQYFFNLAYLVAHISLLCYLNTNSFLALERAVSVASS